MAKTRNATFKNELNTFLEADHFYRTRGYTLGKEQGAPTIIQERIVALLQRKGALGKRELREKIWGKRGVRRANLYRTGRVMNRKLYLYYVYHGIAPEEQIWLRINGTVKLVKGSFLEHFSKEEMDDLETERKRFFQRWGISRKLSRSHSPSPSQQSSEQGTGKEIPRPILTEARALLKRRYLESARKTKLLTTEETALLANHQAGIRPSRFEEKYLVYNWLNGKDLLERFIQEIPSSRLKKYLSEIEGTASAELKKSIAKRKKALKNR